MSDLFTFSSEILSLYHTNDALFIMNAVIFISYSFIDIIKSMIL